MWNTEILSQRDLGIALLPCQTRSPQTLQTFTRALWRARGVTLSVIRNVICSCRPRCYRVTRPSFLLISLGRVSRPTAWDLGEEVQGVCVDRILIKALSKALPITKETGREFHFTKRLPNEHGLQVKLIHIVEFLSFLFHVWHLSFALFSQITGIDLVHRWDATQPMWYTFSKYLRQMWIFVSCSFERKFKAPPRKKF